MPDNGGAYFFRFLGLFAPTGARMPRASWVVAIHTKGHFRAHMDAICFNARRTRRHDIDSV